MALSDIFVVNDGQLPANLLAKKLNSTLRGAVVFGPQSITLPRHGVDCLVTLTFSGSGEFQTTDNAGGLSAGNLDYQAEMTADDVNAIIREESRGHAAGSCSFIVRAPAAAALTFNVTAHLSGPGWSGTAGPFAGVWAAVAEVAGELGRYLSISVAGGADVTLSAAQGNNDVIEATGLLTASINVNAPVAPDAGVVRPFLFINSTTGQFTLTVKTPAGSGILVPQGRSAFLFADAANVRRMVPELSLRRVILAGETLVIGTNEEIIRTAPFSVRTGGHVQLQGPNAHLRITS